MALESGVAGAKSDCRWHGTEHKKPVGLPQRRVRVKVISSNCVLLRRRIPPSGVSVKSEYGKEERE